MNAALMVCLLGAVLLPLGTRCLRTAACALLVPPPRPSHFGRFFLGMLLPQSCAVSCGLAASWGAGGETSLPRTCCLAMSLILLPLTLPLGLPAAGAALCVCVILCVFPRERLTLWGRLAGGLGLFVLGGALMRESLKTLTQSPLALILTETMYALPLGAILTLCAAFLLRDAAAAAAWAALLFPGTGAGELCVLFMAAMTGEALVSLLMYDHGPVEKRFLSRLLLSRILAGIPVLLSAMLLPQSLGPEALTGRCLCFALCSFGCSLVSCLVSLLLLRGISRKEGLWHPYLNEIPPAALYALEKDARHLHDGYRAAATGMPGGSLDPETVSPSVPAALHRGLKDLLCRNLTPSQRTRGKKLSGQLEALCACAPLVCRRVMKKQKPPEKRRKGMDEMSDADWEALERAFDPAPGGET